MFKCVWRSWLFFPVLIDKMVVYSQSSNHNSSIKSSGSALDLFFWLFQCVFIWSFLGSEWDHHQKFLTIKQLRGTRMEPPCSKSQPEKEIYKKYVEQTESLYCRMTSCKTGSNVCMWSSWINALIKLSSILCSYLAETHVPKIICAHSLLNTSSNIFVFGYILC